MFLLCDLFKTYILDSTSFDFFEKENSGVWIFKPTQLFGGRGIKIVKNIQKFKKEFLEGRQTLTR